MKRSVIVMLLLGVLGVLIPLNSGCAPASSERHFTTTRQNKAHVFRNRIHHPGDYRYVTRD